MKLLDTCLVFLEDFSFAFEVLLQLELWRKWVWRIVVVSFGFVLLPSFRKKAPMRKGRPSSTISLCSCSCLLYLCDLLQQKQI